MRYRIDLKKERMKQHLTQAQLADFIGVSEKAVSKWESGRGQPSYENMMKICKLYGVNIESVDNEIIFRKRINISLSICLVLINVMFFGAILSCIVKGNYQKFSDLTSINMFSHLGVSAYGHIADDRSHLRLIFFAFVPLVNVFIPIILWKHFRTASFVAFANIVYCIIAFIDISLSNHTMLLILICIILLVSLFIIGCGLDSKLKGDIL